MMMTPGGFGSLNDPSSQMTQPRQFGGGSGRMPAPAQGGTSQMIKVGQLSSGPQSTTPPAAAKPAMPFGQKNDPGAYGAPGAPSSSPLGEWQSWLNTMGPYLAQMPASTPNVESGGLSSLDPNAVPSRSGVGVGGYGGSDAAPQFNNRGFRMLGLQ